MIKKIKSIRIDGIIDSFQDLYQDARNNPLLAFFMALVFTVVGEIIRILPLIPHTGFAIFCFGIAGMVISLLAMVFKE